MTFDSRIIFPEDDFRMEYRGELKDNNIPHGQGTLTLKGGSITFSGQWEDGVSTENNMEILGIQNGWRGT